MQGDDEGTTVPVWDPLVRIGHWLIVAAFFTAYIGGEEFPGKHVLAGYVLAGVLLLRIAWGFVGSRHARFSDFLRSPAATLRYLRDMLGRRERRYLGHNPAGAAMIVALILSISVTGAAGLMTYAIKGEKGPLAGWVAPAVEPVQPDGSKGRDPRVRFWKEVHEVGGKLALLLVVLHVGGVLYASRSHRENLVKAMLTGRKRAADPADD